MSCFQWITPHPPSTSFTGVVDRSVAARLSAALLLAFLAGCASPAAIAAAGNQPDGVADTATTDVPTADSWIRFGLADAADTVDTAADAAIDSPIQPADALAVCPGGTGCPCSENAGCASSYCIEDPASATGKACTKTCVETCAGGYVCAQITAAGGDLASICVPRFGHLCDPGKILGKCAGIRACGVTGLSTCSAPAAAVEVCNGLDDDCNGQTDEATCDDGKACTQDGCTGKNGCQHKPLDGQACDADGSVCTDGDSCQGGLCVAGPKKNCDDKNPCTQDSCDMAKGCTQVADDGVPCDDENPCTVGDVCAGKKCTAGEPKACTSTKPCVAADCDLTDNGKCKYTNKKTGAACDDGDACTQDDGCQDGDCGGAKLACDDQNACTDDSCEAKTGCVHAANQAPCEDGDKCTLLDACAEKLCVSGKVKVCDDGEFCTVDGCDAASGGCQFACLAKNGAPCDADGSVCTQNDACAQGKCAAGAMLGCDDKNSCTTDSCDSKAGCVNAANKAVCDDGTACTAGDTCGGGKCVGQVVECDDGNPCTDDGCDKAKGCTHAANSQVCSDGNACTSGDGCAGGKCAGTPVTCGDKNPCTADSCDAVKGCVVVALAEKADCAADAKSWCLTGKCVAKVFCGDGLVNLASEECDDGNTKSGDGCDAACKLETTCKLLSTPVCRVLLDGVEVAKLAGTGNKLAQDFGQVKPEIYADATVAGAASQWRVTGFALKNLSGNAGVTETFSAGSWVVVGKGGVGTAGISAGQLVFDSDWQTFDKTSPVALGAGASWSREVAVQVGASSAVMVFTATPEDGLLTTLRAKKTWNYSGADPVVDIRCGSAPTPTSFPIGPVSVGSHTYRAEYIMDEPPGCWK